MSRSLRPVAILVLVAVLAFGGLFAYRSVLRWNGLTPEGYQLLTPMPGSTGFQPHDPPSGPKLENQSTGDLAVNFGYKVGGVAYSYSLALAFAPGAEQGRAKATVRHDGRIATTESDATRRWDAPQGAYAVALAETFRLSPPAPALCIKAVIGPDLTRYALKDATLCVAQRDAGGMCHPETLSCGLVRP